MTCNKPALLLVLGLFSVSVANAQQTQAPQQTPPESPAITAAEQQAMQELFEAMNMATMGASYAMNFLQQMQTLLGASNGASKPLVMQIVEEETTAVVEERKFQLMTKLYPVYARHFNEDEMQELMAFYQTPVGQKTVQLMPELMTETAAATQSWGMSIAPIVMQRVMARVQAAGATPHSPTPNEPAAP